MHVYYTHTLTDVVKHRVVVAFAIVTTATAKATGADNL